MDEIKGTSRINYSGQQINALLSKVENNSSNYQNGNQVDSKIKNAKIQTTQLEGKLTNTQLPDSIDSSKIKISVPPPILSGSGQPSKLEPNQLYVEY